MKRKMRVGVVGAGAISGIYLKNMIEEFDRLEVAGVAARHIESARRRAEQFGIRAYAVEEMMEDDSIELIVNLTPLGAHYDIIRQALLHGKHVYTEKTIAEGTERARELMELADSRHLYLGCAPDTFLGAALQTAGKAIREGLLGEIHSFVLSANRDNEVLLSLFAFLREPGAGILMDYGVYYMTALVSLLGPVKRLGGIVGRPYPTHRNQNPQSPEYGQVMDTPNESQASAVIQLRNGICGTFHIDADSVGEDQAYFAIYGTKGILYLTDPNQFGGTVRYLPRQAGASGVPELAELGNSFPYGENSRGLGVAEMADAILEGRPNRANKEMALHVLEVLEAILKSSESGDFIEIHSDFALPEPLSGSL